MAMTPYTGETLTIANIGTTPQERAMETSEFKMAFSKDFHEFVEWFNDTHKTDFDAVQTEITSHKAESATEEKLGHVIVDGKTILVDENGVISGAALTNKILLHNWDFRTPVNQRGEDVYTTSAEIPTIDRWNLTRTDGVTSTYTVSSRELKVVSGDGWATLTQNIEHPEKYAGKTLTYSLELESSTGTARIQFWYKNTSSDSVAGIGHVNTPATSTRKILTTTWTVPEEMSSTGYLKVVAQVLNGSVILNRAKLEIGNVSTLANDPPAVYSEQLAFCGPVVDTIAPTNYIGQDGQWQVY